MSYHVPSPAISQIFRAAVLSKEVTHFSFPLAIPAGFFFLFLGQGTFKPNSFSGNGPNFPFIPRTLQQPESLSPAMLLSWGGEVGGALKQHFFRCWAEDWGLFLTEYRTAVTISTIDIRSRNPLCLCITVPYFSSLDAYNNPSSQSKENCRILEVDGIRIT